MGISILLWKTSMLYDIVKKEIIDKVNQLRYNLCENKDQWPPPVASSFQRPLTFFRTNYPTCQSIILIPQFWDIKCIKLVSK